MPHEPTIRWIALALLAVAGLWIISAAIGLRPGAMRVRRTIRRSGPATLLCGSCGHPAVSLGTIEMCPECGSVYADVGLDGRASASRWAPPVLVVGVLVLGLWALGTLWLVPVAARWANERSIGAPMVSRERTLSGYTLAGSGVGPPALPPIAIEFDATLFRPRDPAIRFVPPPLASSTITVRASAEPGVAGAGNAWQTAWQSSPYGRGRGGGTLSPAYWHGRVVRTPTPSPPIPQPFASPWEAVFATSPPHALMIDPANERWTLRDPVGIVLAEGTGVNASLHALFDHARLAEMLNPHGVDVARTVGALADAIESLTFATRRSNLWYMNPSAHPTQGFSPAAPSTSVGLGSLGDLEDDTTTHTIHPSAPMGLTAAIATRASLLLVAIAILWLAGRTRRLSARVPG